VRVFVVYLASGWRPTRDFRIADVRPFAAYAGGMAGFTTVNYWSRSIDVMLIGGAFGAAAVGYYSLAYRVIGMPIQLVAGALRPIMHPALVAMNGDTERMYAAYLRLMRFTALVALPFAALLYCTADVLVATLWGDEWKPVGAILRALALLAAVQPLNALSAPIYMATGATSLMFRQSMLQAAILVSAMLAGLQFGLAGVAWGYSIAYAVLVMPIATGVVIRRQLHQPITGVITAILPGLLIAFAILAIAWLA
jgi:PST family polysaccharide transporter